VYVCSYVLQYASLIFSYRICNFDVLYYSYCVAGVEFYLYRIFENCIRFEVTNNSIIS